MLGGIPRITLPENKEGQLSSFIQVYFNNEPYLRCGNLHSYTLENFLREVGIQFDCDTMGGSFRIPIPRGKNYNAIGMGRIRREDESWVLFDFSYDYGLTPNKEHLEKLLSYLPQEIKLRIEDS
ncbi:hypothetical protein KAT24_02245 [Candidatus Pacearchaeota archaeon]|nr:hypothetical protein [Candidatus Pacearchaeota archaeon]